jgi:NitT/TauT family transport system substrate-binding protein
VTDWINKRIKSAGNDLKPVRFSGFPEMKEAFLSDHLDAAFLLAPLSMSLIQQGAETKVVFLGHRDGTAMVVHKDSEIRSVRDLVGKKIAIPSRYSNQFLMIFKGLKDQGLGLNDVKLVEMPPPDMPAALQTKSVDAITSGEPWMAKSEIEGFGRVLYQAKDIWPGFISCVLVVRERLIRESPERVQQLVDGIARSGKWLDADPENRMNAADNIGRDYYKQDPKLLRHVLSKPPDRVTYSQLRLARSEFAVIENLAFEAGLLKKPIAFEQYADARFSDRVPQ